ncbi:uncharacterized protein LOC123864484 [Maniola jurtina]|uniref:uncharacterized protein LOC123864484 n=1 Tax=Maniola jurtina TaxID=191418 RepID=UPI001E6896AF|nr:uncharacterized protein LOC123864484 [Maniola jurtina]
MYTINKTTVSNNINHNKESKSHSKKNNNQYDYLFNECSLFSKYTEILPTQCPKKSGNECNKIFLYFETQENNHNLQIQSQTNKMGHGISINDMQNDLDIITFSENRKRIGNFILIYIDFHDHYKSINTMVTGSLEKSCDSSSYVLTTDITCDITRASTSISKITPSQKPRCILLADKDLRFTMNIQVTRNNEITNNYVPGTALSPMFFKWYFQNITQGLRLKSIFKNININTSRNVVKEDKEIAFHIQVSHQSTQATRVKKYQDIDTNTELERYLRTEHDVKLSEKHSLNSLNSSIWLPKLCGDSSDKKISFLSYILKCSCFNEALVNLDAAEKFIRTTYDTMLSPSFKKVFLKDLGKTLVSMFIHSAI